MPELLGSRFKVQLACGHFGHLIKDLFSYPKFPETKCQRRKDVPLGESWIVHIFIAWGKKLSYFCVNRKTLGRYSHKLSIISKQSKLMHTELRYQVKTHTISNMPREKKKQDQTCECSKMPIQKNSPSTSFSVFPNKYLQNSLKRNRGKAKSWFLDCLHNTASKIRNQTWCRRIRNQILGMNTWTC
jgi:hypothetical protein